MGAARRLTDVQVAALADCSWYYDGWRVTGGRDHRTLPALRAAGAIDEDQRLTAYGREVVGAHGFVRAVAVLRDADVVVLRALDQLVRVAVRAKAWTRGVEFFERLTDRERALGCTDVNARPPARDWVFKLHPVLRSELRAAVLAAHPRCNQHFHGDAEAALAHLLWIANGGQALADAEAAREAAQEAEREREQAEADAFHARAERDAAAPSEGTA